MHDRRQGDALAAASTLMRLNGIITVTLATVLMRLL